MNDIQLSCKEPFRLTADARENSKRLLCGLFCVGIKADLEVSMVTPLSKDQGEGGVKKIKVGGKTGEEEEVMVRLGIVPPGWKPWNHGVFLREWSRTFLAHKREKNLN